MIIAEIIRYNQPKIYETLFSMFSIEVDELPEFKEIKYLMEERRGVAL